MGAGYNTRLLFRPMQAKEGWVKEGWVKKGVVVATILILKGHFHSVRK